MQATDNRPSRRADWQAVGLDVALASMCAYAAGLLATEVTAAADGPIAVATVLVAIAHGASIVLRRRAPLVMVSLLLVTAVAYAALGQPVVFLGPAVLVGMYSVAARLPRRLALATLAGVEIALAALLLGPGTMGLDSLAFFAGLVGGAWFLGDIARRWRALAEQNGRQVEQLQQARAELAAQALALERLRIARELHDVVAHSMSMVAMHSGAARLAVGTDPAAERAALEVVERTTRDALAEMRQLVAVLREHPAADTPDELSPAPGLGDLSGLVAAMAEVGLVVDVRTEGDLAAVPAGLSLTAERVLQEALTNVARHAGPTRVWVVVVGKDDEVRLSVENQPGPGPALPPTPSGGNGLIGMRERVQLYGGTLDAGPTPTGGWRVAARLHRDGATS